MSKEQLNEYEVFELLGRLVEKSLANYDADTGRYSMLETVGEFAAELLVEENETDLLRKKHCEAMIDIVQRLWPDPLTLTPTILVQTVSSDRANFRMAIEYAISQANWDQAIALLSRAGESLFFAGAGFPSPVLEKVLDKTANSTLVNERLALMFGRTYINLRSRQPDVGLRWATAAVEFAEAMQDKHGLVAAYTLAGTAARHLQKYDQSQDLLEKARFLCDNPESDYPERVLNAIGMLYVDTERFQEAVAILDEALSLPRGASDPFVRYNVTDSAIRAHIGYGQIDRAKELLRELLELWPEQIFLNARILLCDRAAQILIEDGQMRQALVLLSFSIKQVNELELRHMPSELRASQTLLERCESALASDVIAECKQLGESMTLDDAITLARLAAEF